jgi:hypothetical protein
VYVSSLVKVSLESGASTKHCQLPPAGSSYRVRVMLEILSHFSAGDGRGELRHSLANCNVACACCNKVQGLEGRRLVPYSST